MPTLPDTTTAFASSATEAQFKTFLSSQRSFLAGLLGTDGTAATARATLGVNDGVTSVNGFSGAITAAQISAAATAGYGYTPANTTHTHSDYVSTNMTHGAVGSLCFAYVVVPSEGTKYVPGSTIAGSLLRATGMDLTNMKSCYYSSSMSGTWRCLGNVGRVTGTGSYIAHTLFQRIS